MAVTPLRVICGRQLWKQRPCYHERAAESVGTPVGQSTVTPVRAAPPRVRKRRGIAADVARPDLHQRAVQAGILHRGGKDGRQHGEDHSAALLAAAPDQNGGGSL